MRDPHLTTLLDLLATEAEAIITGHYDVLDGLVTDKLALFDHLPNAQASPQDLRLIAQNISRNQTLLAAAMKGVSIAKDRLTALQKVRDGLQVYDQSGQFALSTISRPDLVRKA